MFLFVLGYYLAGLVSGLVALLLASERGPLSEGAGVFGLAAFCLLWPVLLPVAVLTHAAWLLEVRASDRQARN